MNSKTLLKFGAAALGLALAAALPCMAEETAAGGTALDAANFPDEALRDALAEYDSDGNGVLSNSELKYATSLFIDDGSIADLTGIDKLYNLKYLYCSNSNLTSADLSGCGRLESISIYDSPALAEVILPDTVESLDLDECALTELDVSHCTELDTLNVSGNRLTALDLTANTALTSLSCNENKLTELDLTHCVGLCYLYASGNALASLDITGLTELKTLYLSENKLTEIAPIVGYAELESIGLQNNLLQTLTVSDCPELENLYCSSNKLTSLTVTACPKLEYLSAYGNSLKALDLSSCKGLSRSKTSTDDDCAVRYGTLFGLDWHAALLLLRVLVGLGAAVAGIVWLVRLLISKTRARQGQ